MENCLVKNSEYRTKLAQSGIPEFEFYSFANAFVAKHGRFPNLDEIPNSDSTKYVKNTLHIKKDNTAKIDDILSTTSSETIEEANIKLNDEYTDLEIKIFPLKTQAIVNIQRRPSEYRHNEIIESVQDRFINSRTLFNGIFNNLNELYGINLIPVDNQTLSTDTWSGIPEVKSSSAFVYNGDIYINTDNADIDAPIHELTHILLGSIRFKNPDLYFDMINSAKNFSNFKKMVKDNPNKTMSDNLEETFVQETAKYLAGLPSAIDNLDKNKLYEIHYNIKRLLDSALMGAYSVKSIKDSKLFNMSLADITKSVKSQLLESKFSGSLDDAALHRMLSNKKSELMRKGDLREECE